MLCYFFFHVPAIGCTISCASSSGSKQQAWLGGALPFPTHTCVCVGRVRAHLVGTLSRGTSTYLKQRLCVCACVCVCVCVSAIKRPKPPHPHPHQHTHSIATDALSARYDGAHRTPHTIERESVYVCVCVHSPRGRHRRANALSCSPFRVISPWQHTNCWPMTSHFVCVYTCAQVFIVLVHRF